MYPVQKELRDAKMEQVRLAPTYQSDCSNVRPSYSLLNLL